MSQKNLQPRTALIVLTALNLLNYADRNVLFAVQPLVQAEFHLNKEQIGYLTSAFLGFYMIAAPFVGPLADRYSRKLIEIQKVTIGYAKSGSSARRRSTSSLVNSPTWGKPT